MTCPRCQTINPEGAMTCASCGAPLVMGAPMGPAGAPQQMPMGGYPPPGGGMYPPQAGYGQPGYGQPGYGQPYMMMSQAPSTSGMAIAGFILALISCSLLGLIFSIIGLNQINSSQGMKTGKGLAVAGIIISVCWFLVVVLAMAGNHN